MRYDIGILALIVLYKTKLTESKSFLSLSASLANSDVCMDLLVYDNTPSCNEGGILEHYDNWKIIYHADSENGGVSKAYNKGAQIAKEMNKKWLLLLDQDTSFPLDTMQKYMQAIDENAHEKLLAPILMVNKGTIISPCYFKFMRGFSVKAVEPGLKSLKIFSVINCGLCIDVDAFNLNGGYNEQIKLDFSDHDFIRRFRKSIGNRLIVIDLEVFHSLSSATRNSLSADMIRFDYYLQGAKHVATSRVETFFLIVNAAIRSMKLSLIHRNIAFLFKLFK